MGIWYILQSFWYTNFSNYGILYQEKSGNPARVSGLTWAWPFFEPPGSLLRKNCVEREGVGEVGWHAFTITPKQEWKRERFFKAKLHMFKHLPFY
jgi:hypothetical protein